MQSVLKDIIIIKKFKTCFSDVILFDNTYSWTRGKKLFYSVELLTSDSTTQAEVDQVSGGDWHRLADQLQVTRL